MIFVFSIYLSFIVLNVLYFSFTFTYYNFMSVSMYMGAYLHAKPAYYLMHLQPWLQHSLLALSWRQTYDSDFFLSLGLQVFTLFPLWQKTACTSLFHLLYISVQNFGNGEIKANIFWESAFLIELHPTIFYFSFYSIVDW